jgi:hypothetical protein
MNFTATSIDNIERFNHEYQTLTSFAMYVGSSGQHSEVKENILEAQ